VFWCLWFRKTGHQDGLTLVFYSTAQFLNTNKTDCVAFENHGNDHSPMFEAH